MKLLSYSPDGTGSSPPRVGILLGDQASVVDLQAASERADGTRPACFDDMLGFLDAGGRARDEAERVLDFVNVQRPHGVTHQLEAVTLHAPVPCPRSLRDCMSFEKHLVQATRTVVRWRSRALAALDAGIERLRGRSLLGVPSVWYERPIYYKGNPRSVVGSGAEVEWPAYTDKLDFELEYGIFIGRQGRDIPSQRARDYIAGYTIFNDFSARDVQLREMQGRLGPAKGKDFDTGNALGPYLVTPDEVPDPYQLTMSARVNGEQWSRGTSAEMHYTFEEIIAYISQNETLYPGDFIGSGTVPGGCGLELDRWIQPGDQVELEVERLGVLRNRIQRKP